MFDSVTVRPAALLYYDYILTFPTELRLIWTSDKKKVSTVLYVLYRYALLANVLYLLAISNKLGSKVRCCSTYTGTLSES